MNLITTGQRGNRGKGCVCVKRPAVRMKALRGDRSVETGATDPKSAQAFVDAGLKLARGFGLAKPESFLQQHGGKLAVGGVLVAGVVALKALKVI
jgi:hypothetical protein